MGVLRSAGSIADEHIRAEDPDTMLMKLGTLFDLQANYLIAARPIWEDDHFRLLVSSRAESDKKD